MSTIGLPLLPGTLPFTCYPASPQELYNSMFQLGAAQATTLEGVVISSSTPTPEQQSKLWIKTNAGFPVGQFVYGSGGQWVWPHASAANGSERRLFVGTLAELSTYDGGDASVAGPASGPMWVEDTLFVGRSPMGPGAIPNTADTLAVSANYGEGKHTMTSAEIAAHTHDFDFRRLSAGSGQVGDPAGPAMGLNPTFDGTLPTDPSGATTPFNVVHPVRGAYVIKRSQQRIYYRG